MTLEVESTIPQAFERVVRAFAERVALSEGGVELSYSQLNRCANRISAALRALPIDRSAPCALLVPQGAMQVAATLGVLKAGGFYLPLDPDSPLERTAQLLREAAVGTVIVNDRNAAAIAGVMPDGSRLCNLDQLGDDLVEDTTGVPVATSSLAYVLYTSGSTGVPKGVMHSHRNVLHNVHRHALIYALTPFDRQTQLYAPNVYGAQRDMFNALLTGASLHIYAIREDGIAGLRKWLAEQRISIYCSVTTVFRRLCGTLSSDAHLGSLRLVKLGGEATYRTDVELFQRHFPANCRLHCGLGSTETGLARSLFVDRRTIVQGDKVPLGHAVEGMEIALLDERGLPVAPGELGEIAVRSRYVALGYWRNEELTQKSFAVDPLDAECRVYFTGDLGVLDSSGCLEHRGRRDHQIKIHGNRVEPAEVETALLRQPAISEAAVVLWRAAGSEDCLVACVVAAGAERATATTLRSALSRVLPAHMLPSRYVWWDRLPTLPNGKLDRKLLAEPRWELSQEAADTTPPRTPLEARLVGIWAEILKLPTVGVRSNFFELGGDSLAAIGLLARLEEDFGFDLSLTLFADHCTIEKLAALIPGDEQALGFDTLVTIRTGESDVPLFCVHGIFGRPLLMAPLSAHLSAERPLYEFQSPRLDGHYFGTRSLRELASTYLAALRERQARGPYALCGYSFGATLAVSMAQLLIAQGEQVCYLAVLDGMAPVLAVPATSIRTLFRRVRQEWQIFRKVGVQTMLERWAQRVGKLAHAAVQRCLHVAAFCGFKVPVQRRLDYLRWNHARLARKHRPERYTGDIDVFYTAVRESRLRTQWPEATTGEVTFIPLTGEHHELHREPYARALANSLEQRLRRAAGAAPAEQSARDGA